MLWFGIIWSVSFAAEPLLTEAIFSQILSTNQSPKRSITPILIPCPSATCSKWNLSHPDTFNHFWIRDTDWLATANRYNVGHKLLPDETSTLRGQLVEWNDSHHALYAFYQNQQPQSFYWTWSRSIIVPQTDPFDKDRPLGLQYAVDNILASCADQNTMQKDVRGNEFAWMGRQCNEWTLWVEYKPTHANALRVMGMRE